MENTRSAAAELGVKAKMICAASAHAGNLEPFVAHHLSTCSVNEWSSLPSEWSMTTPAVATR